MSFLSNSVRGGVAALALLAGSSAYANSIAGIDGNITCSNYTIDISANLVGGFQGTVDYALHLSTGEEVTGSLPVSTTDPAIVDVTETKPWPTATSGVLSVTATVTLTSGGQILDQEQVTQAISVDCPVPVSFEGCTAEFWKDCRNYKKWVDTKIYDKFSNEFDVTPTKPKHPFFFKPVISFTLVLGPVPKHKPKLCKIGNHFSWWDEKFKDHHTFGHKFGLKNKFKHDVTLLTALKGEGTPEKDLMREATAALLNSRADLNYQYSEEQVIKMVQAAYQAGNFADVAALFKAANEQECPL